ncbi:hypothetical protein SAMN05421823_1311, partial [Catalinimonas alkaloidigena]
MKNKSLYCVGLLWLLVSLPASACEVCGCALGGNSYGILPQFNTNFVGLRWRQSRFYAEMNHPGEAREFSHDTYNQLELWGRVYLTRRWQVFAFVPYAVNHMAGTEQNVTTAGLGDASAVVNYTVLKTPDSAATTWRHVLMVGAGVKVPTGHFRQEDKGLLLNPNFQRGTGSVDGLASAVYTVRYGRVGLNLDASYKFNTANPQQYRFGNQGNASAQVFYWHTWKGTEISLLPNAGLYYEAARRHTDEGFLQANTGGKACLFSVGLETYVRRFTLGVGYKTPVWQRFNSEDMIELRSDGRTSLSLTYN